MKKLNRRIFATAGYNTISFGSGRKEFHPKKPMPGFEEYLKETARGTREQLGTVALDEGVISNFMASRFIRQGNLAGFLPMMIPELRYKPCTRVEGACGSGGLAIASAVRSIAAGAADAVFTTGFEVQNTMKAIYGADVLAGAGYYNGERKEGHAFFFPAKFSDRAGHYYALHGEEKTRQAMAHWYELAILNARKTPKAQEHHNSNPDLLATGMTKPNAKAFLENINAFDCSKVSDGASSIVICSAEGLERLGVDIKDCVEILGIGQAEDDITLPPADLDRLETTSHAARAAFQSAGSDVSRLGILEVHDCFTITGLLALEAIGVTPAGQSADFVLAGHTAPDGKLPVNPSGGLIGFGHYTGGTGIRQLVDLLHQFTGKSDNPVNLKGEHGMMVSMGGNDKTVTAVVVGTPKAL